MYNSKRISLIYASGVHGALSNICHGNGIVTAYASVMDLRDAVEDANSPSELLSNLKSLRLVGMGHLSICKDTPRFTRIKGGDALGNIRYLEIEKER